MIMPPLPSRYIRFGILVPSSNTALEPLTQTIISSLNHSFLTNNTNTQPTISVHFSRFAVTTISLTPSAVAQFQHPAILAAAQLLAHAKCDVIGWSGTSAGWLGFEHDEKLCAAIQAETGIPATTSTLALNRALEIFLSKGEGDGERRLGLVTPYLAEMNAAIRANYATIGVTIPEDCSRHLGITDNDKIYDVDGSTLDDMVAGVVGNGAKVVTTFCTNLRAAQRVEEWERRHGVVVLDTVSTVVWDCLRIVGVETKERVRGWGRLFEECERERGDGSENVFGIGRIG